jgi:hypothetical protein
MMTQPPPLLAPLKKLERSLSKSRAFRLFAVVQRTDAPNLWDVVVSAPWMDRDPIAATRELAPKVSKALTKDQLVTVSRLLVMKTGEPFLEAILSWANVEHGASSLQNLTIEDVQVKEAHIITANPRPPSNHSHARKSQRASQRKTLAQPA